MLELSIALFVGILIGTATGLCPGVHINLVAAGLLSSLGWFAGVPVIALVVFIVALSIAHTMIDFIPSVFLGAPNEDNFLSVLPGHELLKEGKGYAAVVYALYGGLAGLVIVLIFSFVFVLFLAGIFDFISTMIPFILIFVSLFLIFSEEKWWIAGLVFILAGIFGYMTFNLPVRGPLLPMLSGLFGLSGLIVSLRDRVRIPKQKIEKLREVKLERGAFWRNSFDAFIAAPLCSFLPGIGSGHASVLGSEIAGRQEENRGGFLFLVGAINVIVMSLSFVAVYSIGKGRTGSAVAVQELLGKISLGDLSLIIGCVIVSAFVVFFIGVYVARFFALYVMKINYSRISWFVIGLLILANLFLSNWIGMIVLVTGSALGVFCILSGVRRIQMMGCLLIPSIVYYLVL